MSGKTPLRFCNGFTGRRYLIIVAIIFVLTSSLFLRQTEFISAFTICSEDSSHSADLSDSTSRVVLPPTIQRPVIRRQVKVAQTSKCDYKGPQQVILLTYGRSGSSLTADIVQKHTDVNFYYEPLHDLSKTFSQVQQEYRRKHNNSHLYLTQIPEYTKEAEKQLELLMTCDYTRLSKNSYGNLHMIRAEGTAKLARCIRQAKTNSKANNVANCLLLHSLNCKAKPVQFLKVIRLSVESVGRLMAKQPNLKMVFLQRDPRGSFLSKKKTFKDVISANTTYEAQRLCRRVEKDTEDSFRLQAKYPGRVLITRYESIAEDPMATSKQLYRFLCIKFKPEIADHVRRMTMANVGHPENPYSLKRKNSTVSSYAWRSKILYSDVKEFDRYCKKVYQRMGFLPVKSEAHLRDMKSQLKVPADLVT